jgi:predicted MPP superfamily phosphohydrolase
MITRRSFLGLVGAGAAASFGFSTYAVAVEPRFRLDVTRYRVSPPNWPANRPPLRIAVVADIHACDPWMPLERIEEVVDVTNGLKPDLTVLLGDFMPGLRRFRTEVVPPAEWGRLLRALKAPLGVHAILGNHDWWTDVDAARGALRNNDIPVMENDVALIRPDGAPEFWLAGLGDQLAHYGWHHEFRGEDDLPGTLARIPEDGRPVVLLAHEPDIFVDVPDRVSLTLCGHTHGGQVNLPLIGRPVVPSRFGDRYAYGHIVENGRNLVVSGGLGCSRFPVRFGVPPEVVLVEVG